MKNQRLQSLITLLLLFTFFLHAQNRWKLCSLPVTADVRNIVFSAPGIILVGTSEGVFWSDDLGESWKEGNGNLPNKNIHAIAALAFRRLVVSTDEGVFLSSDLGINWHIAKQPFFAKSIRELEVDYGLAVYAATENGVWASPDNGDTWLPFGLQGVDLLSIALWVNGEMLAGASRNGNDGIYQTKDFGMNWIKVVDATMGVNTLEMVPHGYFAGTYSHDPFKSSVLKSNQSGTPWEESGLINSSVSCFTYGVVPDMFAGIEEKGFWPDTTSSFGVQHSSDAGKTWSPINEGLTNTNVHSLFMFWENLFAGTSTGIYKRIFEPITKVNNQTVEENIQLNWNSESNSYHLFSDKVISNLNWMLFDMYGRQITNGLERNFNSFEIPLQHFKSGIYFLRVGTDNLNKSFQFIHLH